MLMYIHKNEGYRHPSLSLSLYIYICMCVCVCMHAHIHILCTCILDIEILSASINHREPGRGCERCSVLTRLPMVSEDAYRLEGGGQTRNWTMRSVWDVEVEAEAVSFGVQERCRDQGTGVEHNSSPNPGSKDGLLPWQDPPSKDVRCTKNHSCPRHLRRESSKLIPAPISKKYDEAPRPWPLRPPRSSGD